MLNLFVIFQVFHEVWEPCNAFEIFGDTVLLGCECSCSGAGRVSNFNSNVPQGCLPSYNLKEIRRIFFKLRASTSSGSTGGCGRDAKTIISPNTSFGDIITNKTNDTCCT